MTQNVATHDVAAQASSVQEIGERGKATRQRIIDSGMEVFSRNGFHSTRVDDIVKHARTSHGTFYLYFDSKDDLFKQLVGEVSAAFATLTESLPPIRNNADGRDSLRSWMIAFVDKYKSYGPLIRCWTDAEEPGNGTGIPSLLDTVAEDLAALVRARRTKSFDPAIASLVITAMVERMNYLLENGQLTEPTDRVIDVLVATTMDALWGPGHR